MAIKNKKTSGHRLTSYDLNRIHEAAKHAEVSRVDLQIYVMKNYRCSVATLPSNLVRFILEEMEEREAVILVARKEAEERAEEQAALIVAREAARIADEKERVNRIRREKRARQNITKKAAKYRRMGREDEFRARA